MPLVSDRNQGYFFCLATIRFLVRCFSEETNVIVWNQENYCRIFAMSKGTNGFPGDTKINIQNNKHFILTT